MQVSKHLVTTFSEIYSYQIWNKGSMGKGIILIWTFVVKVIINERKVLTHHESIDCIAEKIVSVTTRVCNETKLWIHSNLRRPRFSFAYSYKLSYFCIIEKWTLEKWILLKKMRKHWQYLKLHQTIKICDIMWWSYLCSKEVLRKLHIQLEIPSCLGCGSKILNV